MQKSRIRYSLFIVLIILLGILSRAANFIPLFIGDILYATMIYFMVRFIFPKSKYSLVFLTALLFCFVIEFQQNVNIAWLVNLRKTLIGRYILGQGFLWSDLAYYSLGVCLGYTIDTLIIKNHKT